MWLLQLSLENWNDIGKYNAMLSEKNGKQFDFNFTQKNLEGNTSSYKSLLLSCLIAWGEVLFLFLW